jgi:hypothetical protein
MRATTILVPLLVFLSGVGSAAAQELSLEFREGLVRLTANNVPASRILDEWTRLGGTRIVNAERVPGSPLTLQLIDVPERQALDTVLRGAAGYMVAARETPVAGASAFDTIFVLPTTTGALATSSAPPPPVQGPLGPVGVPLGQVPTAGLNPRADAPPQRPVDDDAVEDDDEPEPDEQGPPGPVGVPLGQVPTAGLNPRANAPPQVPVDDAVEDDDEPETISPAPPAPRKPSGVTPAPGAARPGVPPPPVPRDPKGVFPSFPGFPSIPR